MLGKQIKKIRTNAGLTQEEFGKKLFHTKSTVSKWENGNQTPDIPTLKRISVLFNVELESLLQGVEVKVATTNQSVKQMAAVNRVNYSGVKNNEPTHTFRIIKIILWLLGVGALMMTFIPLFIAKDGIGPDEITLLLVGLILFLIDAISLAVVYRISIAKSIDVRYNVSSKLYIDHMVLISKRTNNEKIIMSVDIIDVVKKQHGSEVQVEVHLKNGNRIIFFKVDNSVYVLIKNIMKGGKHE